MPHKRGGQPGNRNAVRHGRYSRARREEISRQIAEREPAPKVDYDRVLDELKRLRREAGWED